jgi:RHS repeat-associated protein
VQCVNSGTTTTNTYAADGLRHRSIVGANTTDYVLDGSMFVGELLNGMVKAMVLVGPRGPEYRRDDQAGTIRWYVHDGLGSVVGEVAPDGTLTRSQSFDVYGCVRTSSGTATTKHKFVGSLGHPSDDETGLIYLRARHCEPVCGRFVSEDPGRDGANWYAYCGGNPVGRVDPGGRTWLELDLIEDVLKQLGSDYSRAAALQFCQLMIHICEAHANAARQVGQRLLTDAFLKQAQAAGITDVAAREAMQTQADMMKYGGMMQMCASALWNIEAEAWRTVAAFFEMDRF